MIDILKTILISVFSSTLVFWFGQRTIEYKNKQDNKKKLNKLLFHLLLLKKELSKINGFYEDMNAIINKLKQYLVSDVGLSKEEVYEQFTEEEQQKLIEALKENLLQRDDIEFNKIKENTAILINELAETNPLFALDLNHFYNIDEKSLNIQNSIRAIDVNNEVQEFNKVMIPELENKFTDSFDDIIYQTALKIDNKTYQEVIEIVKHRNKTEVDNEEIDELFNDFIMPMFKKMMENDNNQK
ncbi:hypothetical protein [uncultured Flavobacterium sp.]|uniref:hypothetical protein n=1 Tax=uncultured Flavobacterium sp. TaxID=165435 RepID=UPI002598AD04|nr:hypothetical protein [uncultured Flavobacterium sp.]